MSHPVQPQSPHRPRHTTGWLPAEGNLRSIVAMLVAVAFFSLMDMALKMLSPHYPALQIAAWRGWVALPLVLGFVAWRQGWRRLGSQRWGLHLLRGVLSIGMLALFTFGLQGLPLANAYTLFFVAPLLIAVLSIPALQEQVPRAHWWAIGLGLLGVVVALRPSTDGFLGWHGLAVLGAAACYAMSAVAARLSSRTDSMESLMLWIMVILAVGASLLAWPHWRPYQAEHGVWLVALALSGFGGQLAITEAFRHGQASAVAPFEYTALAWGMGLDWLIWRTLPDGYTLLGAGIIVGSGLYLIRREKTHATAEHP